VRNRSGEALSTTRMIALALFAACSRAAPPAAPPPEAAVAAHFDLPVGPPDATGYYDAQPFGRNEHLGSDWNGVGGGDTDLGDPVHATASGWVTSARDEGGGWGNVVRVGHALPDGSQVESLYAHLDTISVSAGMLVDRGALVGTIGTAHGQYLAHLHFELRDRVGLPLGGGYSVDTTGYLNPTRFVREHR